MPQRRQNKRILRRKNQTLTSSRPRTNKGDDDRDTRGAKTAILRGVGAPDRVKVHLRYPFEVLLSNVAATRVSKAWVSNGAYDPDPSLASNGTPYFIEWSTIYQYFRVLRYTLTISVSSLEIVPLTVYIINTNTDPGTGGANYRDYANGPHGKQFQIAGYQGGKGGTTRMSCSIRQIVGSQDAINDVQYRGTSVSNPADLTYTAVGLQNSSGSLTQGAWVSGHIDYEVEFYDRLLVTTFLMPPPHSNQEVADANRELMISESKGTKLDKKFQDILNATRQWRQAIHQQRSMALSSNQKN